MNKKIMAVVLVVIFMLSSSGCSGAWRQKFVRKKKVEVKEEPIIHPEDYSKEFTNKQLYANHFAFWKAAESEFINSLKGRRSAGRIKSYAGYAIDELKRMHELLVEEKQKELLTLIEELEAIAARIASPTYINSNRNFLVSISSKHYRAVNRGFSYYGMKNYITLEEWAEELAKPKPAEPEVTEEAIEDSKLEAVPDDEAMPHEAEKIEEPEEPEEIIEEIAEELGEPEASVQSEEVTEEPGEPKPSGAESAEPALETEEPEKPDELQGE